MEGVYHMENQHYNHVNQNDKNNDYYNRRDYGEDYVKYCKNNDF